MIVRIALLLLVPVVALAEEAKAVAKPVQLPPAEVGMVRKAGTDIVIAPPPLAQVGLAPAGPLIPPPRQKADEPPKTEVVVAEASPLAATDQTNVPAAPLVVMTPAGPKPIVPFNAEVKSGTTVLRPRSEVQAQPNPAPQMVAEATVRLPVVVEQADKKPLFPVERDILFDQAITLGPSVPTEREMLYRRLAASVSYDSRPVSEIIQHLAQLSGIYYMMPELESRTVSFRMEGAPFRILETLLDSLNMGLLKRNDVWVISQVDKKTLVPKRYKIKHIHLDREFSFRDSTTSNLAAGGSGMPTTGSSPLSGGNSGIGGYGGTGGGIGGFQAGQYEKVTDRVSTLPPKSLTQRAGKSSILARIEHIVTGKVPNSLNPKDDKPTIDIEPAKSGAADAETNGVVDYDPDSNTLYVVTTEQRHAWVDEYLQGIDQETCNIEIVLTFVATGKNDGRSVGMGVAGALGRGVGVKLSGQPSSSTSGITDPSTGLPVSTSTTADQTSLPGNPLLFGSAGHFRRPSTLLSMEALEMRLRLLESEGDSRVSRKPKITTENNRETVLNYTVNRPVAVMGNTTNNTGSGSAVTTSGVNVVNENVGTVVRVLAQRVSGQKLKVHTQVEISNVISTINIAGNEYPIIQRSSINVSPNVESGFTIEIGGLEEIINRKTVEKVPLLGDIPFLGFPFRDIIRNGDVANVTMFVSVRMVDEKGQPIRNL